MIIINAIKSWRDRRKELLCRRERRTQCPPPPEMFLRRAHSQLWLLRRRTNALPRRWSLVIHNIITLYCRSLEFRKTVLAGCSRGRLRARAINISSAGYIRLPQLHMYIIYNMCVVPYIIMYMYIYPPTRYSAGAPCGRDYTQSVFRRIFIFFSEHP